MSKAKRGRPVGSRNKITNEAKQAIMLAFDKLGGVDGLVEWAEKNDENRMIFYTRIFIKVVPRPAVEAAPAVELPPMPKSFTFKTPQWAKDMQKAQLKSGVARIGKPVAELRPGMAGDEAGRRSGHDPTDDEGWD